MLDLFGTILLVFPRGGSYVFGCRLFGDAMQTDILSIKSDIIFKSPDKSMVSCSCVFEIMTFIEH